MKKTIKLLTAVLLGTALIVTPVLAETSYAAETETETEAEDSDISLASFFTEDLLTEASESYKSLFGNIMDIDFSVEGNTLVCNFTMHGEGLNDEQKNTIKDLYRFILIESPDETMSNMTETMETVSDMLGMEVFFEMNFYVDDDLIFQCNSIDGTTDDFDIDKVREDAKGVFSTIEEYTNCVMANEVSMGTMDTDGMVITLTYTGNDMDVNIEISDDYTDYVDTLADVYSDGDAVINSALEYLWFLGIEGESTMTINFCSESGEVLHDPLVFTGTADDYDAYYNEYLESLKEAESTEE